ncbi:electron transporter [Modestobacter sp. Leaf380]|nr:electron transporter [Modestobacter sp. Leaf380]
MGESERGESAPRTRVVFWCANKHDTRIAFACDVEVPETWDCPRCGLPAGQDEANPPPAPRNEPYKTHLAYVRERRSDADGDALLEEALTRLRARRGA